MQRVLIAALLLLPGTACLAQAKAPAITVAKDGYPIGHTTPEGAACELARAFMNHDVALFKSTCIAPFGGGENSKAYETFLKKTAQSIVAESKKKTLSPYGPKTIVAVYAARHLSKNGPASYGYSMFDFKDVQFVDIAVTLHNGKRAMNRTLVLQNSDGRWYVHPFPPSNPILSDGLNQETASTQTITARKP